MLLVILVFFFGVVMGMGSLVGASIFYRWLEIRESRKNLKRLEELILRMDPAEQQHVLRTADMRGLSSQAPGKYYKN